MKIFIFIQLLATLLFSSQIEVETRIYSLIIHSIFPQKTNVKVWTDDNEKRTFLNTLTSVKVVDSPKKADFVIIQTPLSYEPKAIVFTSSYKTLKHYQDDAIGGFYWQKGRPNILFLEDNLKKHELTLPSSMEQYVESSL